MRFFAYGLLFGFILSRVDATNFDAIAGMFLLTDLHLMGVIGVAIVVAAPVLAGLRRAGVAGSSGCRLTLRKKPRKPGNIVGGIIFGAGWAITGTCPGTALSQIGEGKLIALFTVAGIFLGAALYRAVGGGVEAWLAGRNPSPGGERVTVGSTASS